MEAVPTVTEAKAIECIANRFGEWTDADYAQVLRQHYGEEITRSDDPRRATLVSTESPAIEEQMIVSVAGEIGVLSEFETCYEPEGGGDVIMDSNSEPVSDVSFNDLVATYRQRMAIAQSRFPNSRFLVAYGDAGFSGRITLLAFTPFEKRSNGLADYQSVKPKYLETLYEEAILKAA